MRIVAGLVLLSVLLGGAVLCPQTAETSDRWDRAVTALKKVRFGVEGEKVGSDTHPGEFYKLSLEFLEIGTWDGFARLTADPHPMVRVMGAYCLVQNHHRNCYRLIQPLFRDEELVEWQPYGCVWSDETVGFVVRKMYLQPQVLKADFYESKR